MRREDLVDTCDDEFHAVVYDPERAEVVCSKCGLVIDEIRLCSVPEFKMLRRRSALRSKISNVSQHSMKHGSLEKSLRDAFWKSNTPKVVQDKALHLCFAIRRKHLRVGYPVSTLSSALVYAAHRLCRVPATIADCVGPSTAERKKVARCYDNLCRRLELDAPKFESAHFLPILAEKVRIDDDTVMLACEFLKRVREKRLLKGANPIGIAAAALYLAGNLTGNRISQMQLATAAGISDTTLRANYKALNSLLRTLHGS